MKKLENKVAIITGGGAGLGKGAAIAMASSSGVYRFNGISFERIY
jgi:NAD(P)-dependent dehydrogenase (short-subunit alcohol dehydrogenase family)